MSARSSVLRLHGDDGREIVALARKAGAAILDHRVVRGFMLAAVFVLCAFLAWKATDNQLTQTLFGLDPHDSIRRFLAGTQSRPFAYRVFTPGLIAIAQHWLHVPALALRAPAFLARKVPAICARYGAGKESSCGNIVSYFVVGWWLYLGFLLTMFAMARRLFSGSIVLGAATVYLAFAVENAIILRGLSHTYDWGTLLFGALFLWCLLAERPILFCLVMPLACLNKETAVLYTLPFLLANLPRLRPARTLFYVAAQIATFVVIYGGERLYFAGNPGTWMEIHLMGQIYLFSEHINLALLFGLLVAIVLAFYRFPDKHPVLRAACIMIPPWAVLFLIGAVPREIRDTFEILPLLVLMTMQSLVALIAGRTAAPIDRAR
ncbi:MAG: hypothetical protein KGL52_06240 [Rhodospirillales bacterium]|nr:hypothetical protein [Rhodospirillales bacterium]